MLNTYKTERSAIAAPSSLPRPNHHEGRHAEAAIWPLLPDQACWIAAPLPQGLTLAVVPFLEARACTFRAFLDSIIFAGVCVVGRCCVEG